jgi:hypothetical protein
MGTAVENRNQSADGSMATMAQGVRRRKEIGMHPGKHWTTGFAEQRAEARMRLCLKLRQGDKPPETPGPLSLLPDYPERKESVKGSQAAHKTRALDRFLPFGNASPI